MHANDNPQPFNAHSRSWRANRYVYPVCSRRASGISIGINLNLDKRCTFNCVYCQVQRDRLAATRSPEGTRASASSGDVDLDILRVELADMLASAATGRLLVEPEFAGLPPHLKNVHDIAFSGDGEPTASPVFPEAVDLAQREALAVGLDLALVLITNASLLDRPAVRQAVDRLHARRGEVWAKLDAGTEEYFRLVERTHVPFERVVRNIRETARRWPIVIQSCFMLLDGRGPSDGDIAAYCERVGEILSAGRIKLVQVYTVARQPAESFVSPLSRDEVDRIVATIRGHHPGLQVAAFYGP